MPNIASFVTQIHPYWAGTVGTQVPLKAFDYVLIFNSVCTRSHPCMFSCGYWLQIPLATSETYLTEIYEVVCRYMYYYAKATAYNGHTNYILTSSRDGSKISTAFTEVSNEVREQLRFAVSLILSMERYRWRSILL